MTRLISFLRAINVANRIVKKDVLKNSFKELGFSNISTFIASGNVIFESEETTLSILEYLITEKLQNTLGYRVDNFIRTDTEIASICNDLPTNKFDIETTEAINVAFLGKVPDTNVIENLFALKTEIDQQFSLWKLGYRPLCKMLEKC